MSSYGNTLTSADVVVIGGGPAGTSAVWALGQMNPTIKVVLLEQGQQLGLGASIASIENYRSCWPTLCIARMMQRSIEVLYEADMYLGDNASDVLDLKKNGYLYCGFSEKEDKELQSQVEHLHSIGLYHVEHISTEEIRKRFPWLGNNVVGAMFDPKAGWFDSNALINSYVKSVPEAKVFFEIDNIQIHVKSGRVVGVSTQLGTIACPNVIIAAGASSRKIAATAGIDLPVVMRPRQSFTTPWRHNNFPLDAPFIIGSRPYPYVRPEAGTGAIFGWEYRWNTKHISHVDIKDHLVDPVEPVERLRDPRFPSLTLALLARQFKHTDGEGFSNQRYLNGVNHRAGYYVYRDTSITFKATPQGNLNYISQRAILDEWPDIEGLYLSVAHVGHGIMSSPAAGEIIASKVLGSSLYDPSFEDFSLDCHWVPDDTGGL